MKLNPEVPQQAARAAFVARAGQPGNPDLIAVRAKKIPKPDRAPIATRDSQRDSDRAGGASHIVAVRDVSQGDKRATGIEEKNKTGEVEETEVVDLQPGGQDDGTDTDSRIPRRIGRTATALVAGTAVALGAAACSSEPGGNPSPLASIAHQIGNAAKHAAHEAERDARRLAHGGQVAEHHVGPHARQDLGKAATQAKKDSGELIHKGEQLAHPSATPHR